jgi:hypothetical protein
MGMLIPVATLEKPTLRMQPHDEAIFVSGDGRRARRLRRAALVASVLAGLWVVGLGIGMLGYGSLPGISLAKGSRAESPVAPVAGAPFAAARETARALLSVQTAAAAIEASRISNGQAADKRARTGVAAKKKKTSQGAATQPAPLPPVAAVNPAQRTRGWARRDYEAPPGQVRKATATPPPPPSHGRRVGQTPPATPPPAPPGQVRKALDPPPPPPKQG